jgi:2-oxoglutarate ferredoxin oxidoreductase subunit delta
MYPQTPFGLEKIEIPQGKIHVISDRCKGCRYCIKYCPREVLEVSNKLNVKGYIIPQVKNEDACVNCGLCEIICPEFAIWSTLEGNVKAKSAKVVVDE